MGSSLLEESQDGEEMLEVEDPEFAVRISSQLEAAGGNRAGLLRGGPSGSSGGQSRG